MDENHYLRSTFYTNEHITIVIIVVVVVVVVTRLVREEETTIKTESGGWSGSIRSNGECCEWKKRNEEPDDVQSQVSIYIYMFQLL